MNIMVIGSGGREHALVWKLAQSPLAEKIYAVPGNPGIAELATCVENINVKDHAAVIDFAQRNEIGLVVIGPEAPLVEGLADDLIAADIKAFGPTAAAAQLEGSKIFAKQLMKKYAIPTARYEIFSDADAAKDYVRREGAPIVVKADGLAAGKGVIVAQTVDEALNAIDEIMTQKSFGAAGNRIVVEEFMDGEEASLLAFTDGKTVVPMIPSQDHKRVDDGDLGLNTGGMGSYAPAPIVDQNVLNAAVEKILKPTVEAMSKEGKTYRGCLYAGLMIVNGEPKVVEFNARFGDPETQVVLPLLKSDLVELMIACADGTLDGRTIDWSDESAVCVILASGGYPKSYRKGMAIDGINKAKALGVLIFHAGTAQRDGELITSGGRVLGVVTLDKNLRAAVEKNYKAVGVINFEGMHFRHDIAARALNRSKE
ncbi:MAG: phosphoribosylamine--glycine ligase [Selenomonadaceae bacterium]|nr:phosphoribosylamine--glycine ligase [Selenomonadaceae bacterium]